MKVRGVCAWLVLASFAWSQTRLDLKSQTRNVDFATATTTRPVKVDVSLPATCSVGEMLFKSNAPAGSNLFLCVSTNLWSAVAGGGGGGAISSFSTTNIAALPASCNAGDVRFVIDAALGGGGTQMYLCAVTDSWVQFGYVAGASGALAADCSSVPCVIDVTSHVPLKASANIWTGANDFSTAVQTAPFRTGSADPATCNASSREFFFNLSTNTLKSCNVTDLWTAVHAVAGDFSNGYFAPYGMQVGDGATAVNWNPEGGSFVCTQFVAPYPMSISRVGVIVGSAPEAGKALAVGIMDSSFTMRGQGSSTGLTGNSNAVIPLNSAVQLQPGVYYQCVGGEDALTSLGAAMAGMGPTSFGAALNNGTDKRIITCSSPATGTGATFALPASCGTAVAQSAYPIIASLLLP